MSRDELHEEGIIACVLTEPNWLNFLLQKQIPVESFEKEGMRAVYEAMIAIAAKGDPIDELTIYNQMNEEGKADLVGGYAGLVKLGNRVEVVSDGTFRKWFTTFENQWKHREMMKILKEANRIAEKPRYSFKDKWEEVCRTALGLFEIGKETRARTMIEVSKLLENRISDRTTGKFTKGGIITGLKEFDKKYWPSLRGDFVIIGARPSVGKTSFASKIARTNALSGKRGAVFTLEISDVAFLEKMVSQETGISPSALRKGDEVAIQSFKDCTEEFKKLDLQIFDNEFELEQIEARIRMMTASKTLDFVIVDYLQLINAPYVRGVNGREQEVSMISKRMKRLAKERRFTLIMLSQLNRDMHKDKHRAPRCSDLRESGSLEQDADCVILLHQPEKNQKGVYQLGKDSYEKWSYDQKVIQGKKREGPTGEVWSEFYGPTTEWREMWQKEGD